MRASPCVYVADDSEPPKRVRDQQKHLQNQANTQFQVGNGGVARVPILGHMPIGTLFESRQFRDRRTELVVSGTPRLLDPLAKRLRELSTQILNTDKEAEDDVGFGLLD